MVNGQWSKFPISSRKTAFWKKITNILEDFNNWLSGK
jgi:hypothetical protein